MKMIKVINPKFQGLKSQFKNFALILILLVFAGLVLFVSLGKIMILTTPNVLPTLTSVDYFLAYPGILPDNFLYPLKITRDEIWLFLATDSLQKAKTLLLFANKRLGAGKALIDKGEEDLGITTLGKAEEYLETALFHAKIAKKRGGNADAFFSTLGEVNQKHQKVLEEIRAKLSEGGKKTLEEMIKYSQGIYKETQEF